MKKKSRRILIPGLLVSRDQKMDVFDPWDVKSLVLRLCGFLFDFLGRHIDMSYYYSSVFLFLKNFLVFFFSFFLLLHYFLNRSDLNNGAEAYSRPSWLFLSKVLTLFFRQSSLW